jgi:hypothetical protein
MIIDNDKKIDILLSALEERYSAIHKIRNRLQNLGIWALGIFFAASGWLFQSDVYLQQHEQVVLLVFIIVLIFILFKTYIKDLEKGFKGQQRVAAKIENELGFYTDGLISEYSLYPAGWKKAGTDNGEGRYFDTNRILLLTGAFVLALVILSKGNLLF